jgi:nucleotide-binding universal stress UspA family protein
MSKIIVAVDESQGSSDAIALASRLAGITGTELMLVNVFPYDTHLSRGANRAFEDYMRHDSEELLERLRSAHGDESVEVRAIANSSAAHGLHELVEREDAGLIVVGSTHTGRAGRVLPGSTAERLLHGSPCPVAVAPKGYAQRADEALAVVGCGYDGSASAGQTLVSAHHLAAAAGARLRVIRAFTPLAYDLPPGSIALGGGMASYNDTLHELAAGELDAAVATIASDEVEADFSTGDAADVLVEASEQMDLLLVGSRGYGPMRSVVVGGVSGRLMRDAACPVMVLPRGTDLTGAGSLFADSAAAHA